MANDWFVVPLAAGGIGGVETVPKYRDQVDSYSGNWQHFDQQTYSDLPWAGEDRYVVKFYAATQSDLDAIANNNDDAYSLNTSNVTESDVASYLNDVTGSDRSFSEWEQSFLA